MAIDLCSASETSSGLGISPRISFSHDLCQSDVVPVEKYCHRSDASLLDSSFDFDFGITARFEQEPPFSADELFFDGKILPCQIMEKKQDDTRPLPPLPPPAPPLPPSPNPNFTNTKTTSDDSKRESLKEIMATTNTETEEKAPPWKSFWRIRRSSSHNCWNGPLPLLSRCNSTGSSTTNSKRQPLLKDCQKHSHKPAKYSPSSSSSSTQKPLPKKNFGSNGNGIRISPVLNVPSPYIAKGTANLFGLGSLFCTGKDRNKKK